MGILTSEWQGRLRHWIRTLKDDFYLPLEPIEFEGFQTLEYLSPEEAQKGPFRPVTPGERWGNTWQYGWFRGSVTVPESAAGQRIIMDLRPDGESTLFVNGRSFGNYRAAWITESHHYYEDNTLTRCAVPGETFDILMEVYAGHDYPEAPSGGCATGPVLPGNYAEPNREGRRCTMGQSTFGIWNEDAYQLFMDVMTLDKLLQTLDPDSLRAAKIADALEQFTLIVDFEQGREDRTASYRAAREALRPVMEAKNGTTAPEFFAVGNAHIDLPWLWPMQESERKTGRTFAAQLRLLEEYPEYRFIQSQPAAYEMCRRHYPELFERIREAIRQGRWIADGAMWVEPDTNLTGGESLIRQLIHGKRYYRDVLGVDSKVLWLPDTFGYTAALPQILKSCGVDYLVTQKIFWSYNEGERFPYHYFTWVGMDGSKVTSFLPTSYTYRTDPVEVNGVWKNRVQKRDLDAFLFPFGYGDGGGGPSRDYVEYARRQADLEGGAKMKMTSLLEFFGEMDARGGPVHSYVGELYFSAHRGTYTSQAMVKQNNRRSEIALREMEFWSSAAMAKGFPYDLPRADRLWKDLLSMQFHDILPGSSIARVYEEAEPVFLNVRAQAAEMTWDAMKALTVPEENALTVANSLSFGRRVLIDVPESFASGARTAEGVPVPVGQVDGRQKALVDLPAAGALSIVPAAETVPAPETTLTREDDLWVLENSQVRAAVNDRGEVVSFVLKDSGREFAAGVMNRFRLYKDVPRLFDAWDIDSNYILQEIPAAFDVTVRPCCQGIQAVLEVTGKISESSFTQRISLAGHSRRLEFDTQVDWRELHRLLKVSFPVDVMSENAINEMQFGYVQRPTHRSRAYDQDRFEVCNHRYTALCDGGHGAAVLNDCKYGISVNGNAMELTLLRAAASPELRADNRVHRFTYGFTAWEGSFETSDVIRQGYDLNVKPLTVPGRTEQFSLVSIDRDNVFLETLKPAEDGSGDLILRLYEAKKAACSARITLNLPVSRVSLCDMLENELEELSLKDGSLALDFRAFEIKTLILHL